MEIHRELLFVFFTVMCRLRKYFGCVDFGYLCINRNGIPIHCHFRLFINSTTNMCFRSEYPDDTMKI